MSALKDRPESQQTATWGCPDARARTFATVAVAVTMMPDAATAYLPWVGVLCCFNIIYGGLVATAQKDMKFVVGYSSSATSRYHRFMQHRSRRDEAAVERGTHPRPGLDFTFVATIPAPDGIDIVGAAQYVGPRDAAGAPGLICEFAVTLAEDWRGSGLAGALMKSLLRPARRDGYAAMEGWILAENAPMLRLARRLGFRIERDAGDATVMRALRTLQRPGAPCP